QRLDAGGGLGETVELPYLSVRLTDDVALLQINNRSEASRQPLFKLVNPDPREGDKPDEGGGAYAVRATLLLYDPNYRGGFAPYVVRKYETLFRLRGM
ncbi:MAG: hypothetical protein LBU64_08435, partial [Planctomycetota bacterium]|nr:hypothetical protein [Planctomycetota bacterium]